MKEKEDIVKVIPCLKCSTSHFRLCKQKQATHPAVLGIESIEGLHFPPNPQKTDRPSTIFILVTQYPEP